MYSTSGLDHRTFPSSTSFPPEDRENNTFVIALQDNKDLRGRVLFTISLYQCSHWHFNVSGRGLYTSAITRGNKINIFPPRSVLYLHITLFQSYRKSIIDVPVSLKLITSPLTVCWKKYRIMAFHTRAQINETRDSFSYNLFILF